MDILEINQMEQEELVKYVSQFVCPNEKLKTVKDLENEKRYKVSFLKTNINTFDDILNGGIPCGSITEIAGPSGVGKTQFCFTISIEKAWQPSNVLYLDTEMTFEIKRIKEILKNRFNNPQKDEIEFVLRSIHHVKINNVQGLLNELKNLEKVILDNNYGLLILDSIAAPFRREFGRTDIVKRQEILNQCASILKNVAESCNIPVIVTNHMTFGSDVKQFFEDKIEFFDKNVNKSKTPALGNTWFHCVNTRLLFEKKNDGESTSRIITIQKSPICAQDSIKFVIEKQGIVHKPDINTNEIKKQKI